MHRNPVVRRARLFHARQWQFGFSWLVALAALVWQAPSAWAVLVTQGDDGADTVEVNGALAGDVFSIAPNGPRVRFSRTNQIPFALDIGATEQLTVNGLGGDDAFNVIPLETTTVLVSGEGPDGSAMRSESLTGSVLTVDAQQRKVEQTTHRVLVAGRMPVEHLHIDLVVILNAIRELFLPSVLK